MPSQEGDPRRSPEDFGKSGYEERQFHFLGSFLVSRRLVVSVTFFLAGFLLIALFISVGGSKTELMPLSGLLAALAGFFAVKHSDSLIYFAAFTLGIFASAPLLVLAVIFLEQANAVALFRRDLHLIAMAAAPWLLGVPIGHAIRKVIRPRT